MDLDELKALTRPDELDQSDPREPVEVDGFKVADGSLLESQGVDPRNGEPRHKTALKGRSLQLLAHIVEREDILAVRALISFGDRPARPYDIPSSVAVSRAKGAEELSRLTGRPWTPEQAGTVGVWLTRATSVTAPEIRVVSKPTWSGGWLLLPGVNTHGTRSDYGAVHGHEEEALAAWREIVDVGERHPRFALYIGAAMIAPFLSRLELDVRGFIANIYGNQNSGKTESLRTAAAAFGIPKEDHLLRDWRGTSNALLAEVRDAGLLPVFMDDTSKITPERGKDANEVIEDMAYAVSGGRDKSRLRTDGSLVASSTFETVVLSTSEAPILAAGRSGMISRIVEIPAPLINAGDAKASAELQRRLEDLSARHCGWPLRWILDGGIEIDDPKGILRRSEYAFAESGDPLERASRNFAACALGWNILAVAVEHSKRPSGEELGRAVFAEFREHAETVGISQEERLWAELPGFVLANARRIEGMSRFDDGQSASGDVIGRWWKESGNVALIPSAVRQLAKDLGLGDPTTALSGLAKDGRLQVDSEGKLQRSVRIAGKGVRAYEFVGLLPEATDETVTP